MRTINQDISLYPALQALVHQHQVVLDAFASGVHWVPWASDFVHGLDWKVSPIYLSPEVVATLGLEVLDGLLAKRYAKVRSLLKEMLPFTTVCGFSLLQAGQVLHPHTHENEGHLIFHMGVRIPTGCALQFELNGRMMTHEWKKAGDYVLFDDNLTHAAWNHSDEDRVIFYLDFAADLLTG